MIIIKIGILYFIQIRHTDDFPSTSTRLVVITNAVVSTKSDDGSCIMLSIQSARICTEPGRGIQ